MLPLGAEVMCLNITLYLSKDTWEKSNDFDHIKLRSNKEAGKWRDGEVGSGGGERGGGGSKKAQSLGKHS